MLDEDGSEEGKTRQSAKERPDGADAMGQGSPEDYLLRICIGHGVDPADQRHDVETVRGGRAGQGGIACQVGGHAVLEDDSTDGDADGLAEATEEGEHGGGNGDVFCRGGGLDGEGHGGEEQADTDAGNEHEKDPGRGSSGRGEQVE